MKGEMECLMGLATTAASLVYPSMFIEDLMCVASKMYLDGLVDFANQLFSLIPAQTRVSNGFSKDFRVILTAIF